jgi:hypothetical protein
MPNFWTLMAQSVITQSVVTAAVIITDCVMTVMQVTIPVEMWTLTMLVCGFWFGSKVGYVQGAATTTTTTKVYAPPCPEVTNASVHD